MSHKTAFEIQGHKIPSENHIDNGFFYIADQLAGKIARKAFHDGLPGPGMARRLHDDQGRECWIQRTGIKFSLSPVVGEILKRRGYCWAIQHLNLN